MRRAEVVAIWGLHGIDCAWRIAPLYDISFMQQYIYLNFMMLVVNMFLLIDEEACAGSPCP